MGTAYLMSTRSGIAFILLLASTSAGAQPKIQVEQGTRFDFGKIFRGAILERELTLKNTGTDTLILGKIDASCGCTGAISNAERIPAGGTGTLHITFNSKNFVGPVHKTVTVHSNAADAQSTLIEFTADVVDEIALNPPSVFFQGAEVKKTSVAVLKVTNNGMGPLALSGYRTHLKGLVVKLPAESIPPGATAEIRAEFTPEESNPMLTDAIFVTTNNIRQPEVFIQVFGGVKESKPQ